MNFCGCRYRIEGSREFKTDQHSGVWELNKAEGRCVRECVFTDVCECGCMDLCEIERVFV